MIKLTLTVYDWRELCQQLKDTDPALTGRIIQNVRGFHDGDPVTIEFSPDNAESVRGAYRWHFGNEWPVYTHDGKPDNLPAAASDALLWLRVALDNPEALCQLSPENKGRLARATSILSQHVAALPPDEYLPKPPEYPGVVALIVRTTSGGIEDNR